MGRKTSGVCNKKTVFFCPGKDGDIPKKRCPRAHGQHHCQSGDIPAEDPGEQLPAHGKGLHDSTPHPYQGQGRNWGAWDIQTSLNVI